MQLKVHTYEQFLDYLNIVRESLTIHSESSMIIERFRTTAPILTRFAPVSFLLDFSTKKYIYVDKSCFDLTGYSSSYFLETGLESFLSTWHPVDFEIMNKKIIPENFEFLKTLPAYKYGSIVFSYNYRTKNAEGNYNTVLQRFSYVPSNVPGVPFGIIGVVFDISHFKNDLSIVHTIEESVVMDNAVVNKLIYKKVYPVYEINSTQFISKRELDILKYMAGGLSSKQIADRLSLSTNTVNNHRKNMLKKMNCKSSPELLNYVSKHGIL